MRYRVGRRLIALLTVLLLSLGSVGHGAVVGDMNAKMMTAAAVGMPMSQDCDACGGDGGMPDAVCYSACNGSVAVLSHPMPVKAVALGQSEGSLATSQISWPSAPDPSPPKPVILS